MERSIKLWQFFGFAFTSFAGTILHFLYDLLDAPLWIAPFSGINESTWEHMKLLFWPMLLFAVFQGFFFRDREDFICIKLRGILLGMALIPILFYTYNGAIGKSPDFINISIFFIAAALSYIYETHLLSVKRTKCKSPVTAAVFLLTIALLFIIFTFSPPRIGLFKDPITGLYGI